MTDYIKWLRERVGHDTVILNAAAAIVVDENGSILMQRRGDREAEVWGIPGGMMEIGETAEQTIQREVLEETGLTVSVDYFQGAYTNYPLDAYPNGDKTQIILFVFVCKKFSGVLREDGHETLAVEFTDPKNLHHLSLRHRQVIDDYIAGLRGIIR